MKRYLIINNNFLHASRQYSFRTEVSRTPNNSRNGASEGLDASELLVRCLGTIYSCFACSLHRYGCHGPTFWSTPLPDDIGPTSIGCALISRAIRTTVASVCLLILRFSLLYFSSLLPQASSLPGQQLTCSLSLNTNCFRCFTNRFPSSYKLARGQR